MNKASPLGSLPTEPVFIRMPSGPGRELWPGSGLDYWKLRPLISPGPWNNQSPLVRAYDVTKACATRGTPLIEHVDLIEWLNSQFHKNSTQFGPLPLPNIQPPPVLTIPPRGGICPVTQLKRTTMYQLSLPISPYGVTGINVTRYALPHRKKQRIVMVTESLLQFIRSFPPPIYKISPPNYPLPPEAPSEQSPTP